jgi:hypothetical protein
MGVGRRIERDVPVDVDQPGRQRDIAQVDDVVPG